MKWYALIPTALLGGCTALLLLSYQPSCQTAAMSQNDAVTTEDYEDLVLALQQIEVRLCQGSAAVFFCFA